MPNALRFFGLPTSANALLLRAESRARSALIGPPNPPTPPHPHAPDAPLSLFALRRQRRTTGVPVFDTAHRTPLANGPASYEFGRVRAGWVSGPGDVQCVR